MSRRLRVVVVSTMREARGVSRAGSLKPSLLLALVVVAVCSPRPCASLMGSSSGVTKPEKPVAKGRCLDMNGTIADALERIAKVLDMPNKDTRSKVKSLDFSTCAVVGNGGTLKTTKFGRAIDSHAVVMRANQAPIKRYERIVGKKTTFRVLNKRWLGSYAAGVKYLPLEDDVILTTSRGVQGTVRKLHQKYQGSRKVHVATLTTEVTGTSKELLMKFRRWVRCRKKRSFPGGNTVTSGLFEVVMALTLCKRVTVYGFGSGGGQYQYYKFRHTERARGESMHSFDGEKALILQMERYGLLKTCFGKSKGGNCGMKKDRAIPKPSE